MTDPVTALLEDVCRGTGLRAGIYADDVVLDATVPGWRLAQHGEAAVRAQLGEWFADPGSFEELSRVVLPDGELVTFTLRWIEDGEPWSAHQVHLLRVEDGRITWQQAWCGGRWSADRVAAMAAG